jgi:hypothetical protein
VERIMAVAHRSSSPACADKLCSRTPHPVIFRKQPDTPEELDRVIAATEVSCVLALRYAGADPEILERLRAKGLADRCDVLIPPEKIPPAEGDPGLRMIALDCTVHPEWGFKSDRTEPGDDRCE